MIKLVLLKEKIDKYYYPLLVLILLVAFLLRLLFCLYFPSMPPDSSGYYMAAINIANGNGYSINTHEPFTPYFFREPLTSYLFATVVWLYKFFLNKNEILEYPVSWIPSEMQSVHQQITFGIRILFIIMQLTAIYLFSVVLRKKSNKMFSLVFMLICAFYFPLVANLIQPLREPLVFFLLSILAYFWSCYLEASKFKYIILMGFINGLLCLCLQSYWLLAFFVALFILINKRREISIFFVHSFSYIFVMSIVLSPHIYNVYRYYPDIRIVRTLGTAATYEYFYALNAYAAWDVSPYSVRDGDLPRNIETHSEYFTSDNSADYFKRSFDGTFKEEADRINGENTMERKIGFLVNKYAISLRNTIFLVGITYDYGVFVGNFKMKDFLKLFFVLPYLIFGLIAVIGLWFFLKKFWLMMPVFFYHSLLFFVYGDEERRQVMLIPYIICIVMYIIWVLFFNRQQKNENISSLPNL